jgi:Domain of unknown function (DUF4365)
LLTKNHRQEALSRAYIQAVAARCGMSCSFRDFDYGIDVTVHEIKRRGEHYAESGVSLDIQAKSLCGHCPAEADLVYDLKVKNYEDLRDPENPKPRILVLLLLPDEESEWTSLTADQLIVRRCAYWRSFMTQPPTANKDTIRVAMPRDNLFSPEALTHMFATLRAGESLC